MLNYIVAVALFVAPAIAVPWTNATCVDDFWSFNSHAQSPCMVAAYLGAQCTTDNTYGIYALTSGGPYGFTAEGANNCVCNSVMWNLLSACALCQKASSGSWGQWVASCPSNMITVGKYPIPLPANVAVPSWAYYDFTTAGAFNAVTASQQTGIESSAVSGPASTFSPDPEPTVTTTRSGGSTATPKPTTNQSQSSSNMGAIIGGVVGGVLGIGLIGLIAFVLVRKRKPEESSIKYPEANQKPPMTAQSNLVTPMTATPQLSAQNQPASTPEYKPYDPSDPSTFPTTPIIPANGHYTESLPYSYHPQGTPGQYPYPSVPQV